MCDVRCVCVRLYVDLMSMSNVQGTRNKSTTTMGPQIKRDSIMHWRMSGTSVLNVIYQHCAYMISGNALLTNTVHYMCAIFQRCLCLHFAYYYILNSVPVLLLLLLLLLLLSSQSTSYLCCMFVVIPFSQQRIFFYTHSQFIASAQQYCTYTQFIQKTILNFLLLFKVFVISSYRSLR